MNGIYQHNIRGRKNENLNHDWGTVDDDGHGTRGVWCPCVKRYVVRADARELANRCPLQMVHSLAPLALGGMLLKVSISQFSLAGWLMLAGIVFFSGSLYVMALTGVTKLGAITPIGGVLFIAAWIFVAIGAYKGL